MKPGTRQGAGISQLLISPAVRGEALVIGEGFRATHLSEERFNGLMDPVVMMDHFHMTRPTFDPHPHAGISAVTYVFEDSRSPHVNHDSLGHHGPIEPGSLHWFAAGRGAIHTERPEEPDAHVHALQIFVNLPSALKSMPARAIHVPARDIPEHQAPGVRIRVVLGSCAGVEQRATSKLPTPFALLDGFLEAGASMEHPMARGWSATIYVVSGALMLHADGREMALRAQQGLAVKLPSASSATELPLRLSATEVAHFVLLGGPALEEPLVRQGPFVMNTAEQMRKAIEDYRLGRMGSLSVPPLPWS